MIILAGNYVFHILREVYIYICEFRKVQQFSDDTYLFLAQLYSI